MAVTVVRTLVYTYPDADEAMKDMTRWEIPATGVRYRGTDRQIASATTPIIDIGKTEDGS